HHPGPRVPGQARPARLAPRPARHAPEADQHPRRGLRGAGPARRVGKYSLTGICLVRHTPTMIVTFTALAEPNRLRIVELLRDGPLPVGAIGRALKLTQPQVSKHLRVLKQARLVAVEPRAQQRLYGLRPEPLRELNGWLERYRSIWDERMYQ